MPNDEANRRPQPPQPQQRQAPPGTTTDMAPKPDHGELRWSRKFGQGLKLGLLLTRTNLNDGQTEAVFCGFQGEGCS